ncbi:MAG: metal-dependent hydrolase [Desulfovibrionaceae bacterium]|nr:metal-dependent hydrolase [Desulfovibrionaceae bacterium]
MPTILTHVAVPVSAAVALGWRRIPGPALLAGMLAAIAPDLDGIAFKLGIASGGMTGHRGFTHTLLFALLLGLAGYALAPRWRMRRWAGYAWIALCTLSHPLLDMMTNGGAGIALLWPLDSAHRFFSWRPIEVSPVSLKRLMSPRGAQVLRSEALTVWAPLMSAALLAWAARHGLTRRQKS